MIPIGIVTHAMTELFHRDELKLLPAFNKELNTFKNKPLEDYPEYIRCKEFITYLGLSTHGYIYDDGEFLEGQVGFDSVAFHAGKSRWQENTNLNKLFLGFEFIIPGANSYADFVHKINKTPVYTDSHYVTGARRYIECAEKYPTIRFSNVVRHSDISGDDIRGKGKGKVDPGNSFDWKLFKTLLRENWPKDQL